MPLNPAAAHRGGRPHTDPLQSSTLTLDSSGGVRSRLYYTPWGQRTDEFGAVIAASPNASLTRGFTGHEHDDELGLVNMQGRLYDPRLKRFLSADPLSEVPTRFPLECVIQPCDESDTSPQEGSFGVSLVRFGGDESGYSAESSTGSGSRASSFGRGPRDADGMALGLAELNLLSERAGVEPASSVRLVQVMHADGLNRYAYAYNNPVKYRDPSGYYFESAIDAISIGYGVWSLIENVRGGNAAAAVVDAVGIAVDVVALALPVATVGAAMWIKAGRAADIAKDTAQAGKAAANAGKGGNAAANTADAAKKAEKSLSSEQAFQKQYAEAGKQAAARAGAKSGETAATAAGRAAHKAWQPPPGFQKEFRLPSGRRADAVNPKTREVIELKPNNPRAIREGQRQLDRYLKELEETTGQKWTGRVETY